MATNNAANFAKPIGVASGGTGVATLTAYAPLCGGTTSTGALQQGTTGLSTSGSVLTSAGAGALPTFVTPGSLIKLGTLTASNSATLAFTSSQLTSTYDHYLIVFSQIVNGTSAVGFLMKFSTNNGGSYLTSSYQSASMRNAYTSTTFSNSSSTAQANIGVLSNATYSGFLFLNRATGQDTSYVGRGFQYDAGSPTNSYCYGRNNTNSVNNIQFSMSSGNIASGTITLYGIVS
jgi:hypothetical protein